MTGLRIVDVFRLPDGRTVLAVETPRRELGARPGPWKVIDGDGVGNPVQVTREWQ